MVLELQSGFAGGVGDCRDPPVVEVAASIEDDLGDAGGLGPLGDELADLGGGVLVARGRAAQVGSVVEAAASVRPARSSITWAVMCLFERNTARRGRSAVPCTFLRTRR